MQFVRAIILASSLIGGLKAQTSAVEPQPGDSTQAAKNTDSVTHAPPAAAPSAPPVPTAAPVASQAPEQKKDAFTLHPVTSIAISGLSFSYESSFSNGWAYEIPAYVGYSERLTSNATLFAGSGFGVRRYLAGGNIGAYVSPELEFLNRHQFAQGPDSAGNILYVMPSVRMAYKFQWDFFTLDLGFKIGFIDEISAQGVLSNDTSKRILVPMGTFAIGVPF